MVLFKRCLHPLKSEPVVMPRIPAERQYLYYLAYMNSERSSIDVSSKPILLDALKRAMENELHDEIDFRARGTE